MTKNIVVFSDGTGQDGGARPEQRISNIYKMYRASRDHADDAIDPSEQVAFYDAGLGTDIGATALTSPVRFVQKLLGSVMGAGIKRNIADCYEFIINHYRPGDRIFLFGFSRGAYTVRSLANLGDPSRCSRLSISRPTQSERLDERRHRRIDLDLNQVGTVQLHGASQNVSERRRIRNALSTEAVARRKGDEVKAGQIETGDAGRVELTREGLEDVVCPVARNDEQYGQFVLYGCPERLDHIVCRTVADDADDLARAALIPLGERDTDCCGKPISQHAARHRKERSRMRRRQPLTQRFQSGQRFLDEETVVGASPIDLVIEKISGDGWTGDGRLQFRADSRWCAIRRRYVLRQYRTRSARIGQDALSDGCTARL
jgi:hypothetical protein